MSSDYSRLLTEAGLDNTATGTWETADSDLSVATNWLSEVLLQLDGLDDETSAHLDHLWIYMDRADS